MLAAISTCMAAWGTGVDSLPAAGTVQTVRNRLTADGTMCAAARHWQQHLQPARVVVRVRCACGVLCSQLCECLTHPAHGVGGPRLATTPPRSTLGRGSPSRWCRSILASKASCTRKSRGVHRCGSQRGTPPVGSPACVWGAGCLQELLAVSRAPPSPQTPQSLLPLVWVPALYSSSLSASATVPQHC